MLHWILLILSHLLNFTFSLNVVTEKFIGTCHPYIYIYVEVHEKLGLYWMGDHPLSFVCFGNHICLYIQSLGFWSEGQEIQFKIFSMWLLRILVVLVTQIYGCRGKWKTWFILNRGPSDIVFIIICLYIQSLRLRSEGKQIQFKISCRIGVKIEPMGKWWIFLTIVKTM